MVSLGTNVILFRTKFPMLKFSLLSGPLFQKFHHFHSQILLKYFSSSDFSTAYEHLRILEVLKSENLSSNIGHVLKNLIDKIYKWSFHCAIGKSCHEFKKAKKKTRLQVRNCYNLADWERASGAQISAWHRTKEKMRKWKTCLNFI